ncbi:MAG: hypothetical protein U5J99_04560 [Parvularculaceae bacterium]|nr:hypothetical protein [Parvularculaceae bacterium]
MARRLKLLTGLSTIALTGALALAGCGAEGEGEGASVTAAGATASGEGEGEGEGAAPPPPAQPASGEGEGGVDIAAAATDPVVFKSALAIAEAHVLAARDAHAAGRREEAAEMFAHPVSEVLADMEGAFVARGVAGFNNLFIDASQGVIAGETPEQISTRTAAIVNALNVAAEKAPSDRRSAAAVSAGVVADQIDRAVDMYRAAAGSRAYGNYLDGYGFYKAAESAFARSRATIETENPAVAAQIVSAMAALGAAYPSAQAPGAITGDVATLSAASSRVMLALGR